MRFLTVERVISIQDDIVTNTGGERGVLNEGNLVGCIEACYTRFFGFEPHTDLFEKAAALMYCLIHSHPFNSANKRTGFHVTGVFLALNGYYLRAGDDAVSFCKRVDLNQVTEREIAEWLVSHSTFFGEAE
jgi:death-on-curing protein